MAVEKNETIKKAKIEMNYLTGDAEVRRLADLREKWEMDYNSGINYAKSEGLKEGLKEGEKKGKKEEQIKIAKAMLKENLSIEFIAKITQLTTKEIEELKEDE